MTALAATLVGSKVILAVTGSIAAYKAPALFRRLAEAGADVRVVMTNSASQFVGAATFRGLGAEVFCDMWAEDGEAHVSLAKWADAVLVAPATADTLARLTVGRGDDLLSATCLCFSGPLFIAPAMHPTMWAHPATAENVSTLRTRGARFIGPARGEVASGDTGLGRFEEPERIVGALAQVLAKNTQPLAGRHIVVTAGPTREPLDPVRALTNISSGKMGYAVAEAALQRGARVTLISGSVALDPPALAHLISVESASEMEAALSSVLGPDQTGADALIMAAAVSDYRPKAPSKTKLKRTSENLALSLEPNSDILANIGKKRAALRPVLVGFALETAEGDELVRLGREKLVKKQADLIVANSAQDSLGREDNRVRLISARDCVVLEKMKKTLVASHLIDWVEKRLSEPADTDQTH